MGLIKSKTAKSPFMNVGRENVGKGNNGHRMEMEYNWQKIHQTCLKMAWDQMTH